MCVEPLVTNSRGGALARRRRCSVAAHWCGNAQPSPSYGAQRVVRRTKVPCGPQPTLPLAKIPILADSMAHPWRGTTQCHATSHKYKCHTLHGYVPRFSRNRSAPPSTCSSDGFRCGGPGARGASSNDSLHKQRELFATEVRPRLPLEGQLHTHDKK